MKILTIAEKNYIAGFLDGDGSIFAQLVPGKSLKYKYRVRVTVGFYQHKKHRWFLMGLKKKLKCGVLRTKTNDNVMEFTITAADPVKNLLLQLSGCLLIKKRQANLVLELLEKKRNLKCKADFIEVCKLVDKVAALNYSKNRIITSETVAKVLLSDDSIL